MQGGGSDVDINYQRMGEFAGGGDFVVLRASGDDGYNQYIFDLCACDSVETVVFDNRDAAHNEFVIEKIRSAWRYVQSEDMDWCGWSLLFSACQRRRFAVIAAGNILAREQ